MTIIKKVFFLLNSKERKRVIQLTTMFLFMGLLDTIGVASIMPFIAVLMNPEIIDTNHFLNKLFIFFGSYGIKSKEEFLFLSGVFVFLLLVFSLTFKAITTYMQIKFVETCNYSICKRLVERYLQQPYSWFLNRHSADIEKHFLKLVQLREGSKQ